MMRLLLQALWLIILYVPLLTSAETRVQWHDISSATGSNSSATGSLSSSIGITPALQLHPGALMAATNDTLVIAAGNPDPALAQTSQWYVAHRQDDRLTWHQQQLLKANSNNSAATGHPLGIFVVGGTVDNLPSNQAFLLRWDQQQQQLQQYPLPPLPRSARSPSAVIINNQLYVMASSEEHSPQSQLFRFDLGQLLTDAKGQPQSTLGRLHFTASPQWQTLPGLPVTTGQSTHHQIRMAVQNNGRGQKLYAISKGTTAQQIWQFDPTNNGEQVSWQPLGQLNVDGHPVQGDLTTLVPFGQSHLLAFMANQQVLAYNVITQRWAEYQQDYPSPSPAASSPSTFNPLAVVPWQGELAVLTAPTQKAGSLWQATLGSSALEFGWQNMTVLVVYLLLVVVIGLIFVLKNRNTDDYFRGGQSIPWWAAACSIYATMLSSLTYVALPAIVYQTDWLLLFGVWTIVFVAPIAIYVAMPFFRQIDATSAYEYLSKRFNMSVRLFASGLFTLFHIGRMGIVMALTALALSAVTPLSASECVLIMGILCLIYCTLGGIEAVIWTDTMQTVVLLIGAVVCFVTIITGIDGGFGTFIDVGLRDNKFTMVDASFDLDSATTLSIWVIILGGIGQNISSYTADQAVVQRYMVTSDSQAAKKSIWANALIAGPSALLFFCIGTGLYVFYQSHPEKLNPGMQIDQIFPAFIATELPLGIAGLIVAGIFAAAQSTVSTSMNSIASTLVTDFVRPFNLVNTEKGYMNTARWLTFIVGVLGTLAGLIFIDPTIRSLMEAYFKIIGMFMGALGGLFVLGALTRKANASGALVGILSGVAMMFWAWQAGWANGYLYATIGILSCLIIGYLASWLTPGNHKDLDGLTLYTMRTGTEGKKYALS